MSLERLLDLTGSTADAPALYESLNFPDPPEHRPYVYINMAGTADGKIVVGPAGGSAVGVGGPTDQLLFRRLQRHCDGAFIGASTLRASNVIYPPEIKRFVLTSSGDLPASNRFFTDAPTRAYAIVPAATAPRVDRLGIQIIPAGDETVDICEAFRVMRQDHGVRTLLCEGGGELNAQLLALGLADELFLTVAPWLKGGRGLPGAVGGDGAPPGTAYRLSLLSVYRDESELYLRYKVLGIRNAARQSVKRTGALSA